MSPSLTSLDAMLGLLRTAVRMWGAFLEAQLAFEQAAGLAGTSEIRDYILDLEPEFIDDPEGLTVEHVSTLIEMLRAAHPDLGSGPLTARKQ